MNSEVQNNLLVISGSFDKKRKELENQSDAEIWRQFKMGDEMAFIFIYEKYFDRLVNYCYQFSRNKELIKDCVQDLFI